MDPVIGPILKLNSSQLTLAAQASFRDPAGRLFFLQGRVLRALNSAGSASFHEVWNNSGATAALGSGSVVSTRCLDSNERLEILTNPHTAFLQDGEIAELLEHEPAPFPNYPHEWPPEMLYAAGALTMRLARTLLPAG